MNSESETLIKEVHKAASSGLEAIETVLPKIKKPQLKKDIEHQGVCYQELIARCEKQLQKSDALPEKNPTLQKAVMWGAIQLNTLADASTSHMAEMMINGTNMGIVEMTRHLNSAQNADSAARKLAEDFLHGEQLHLNNLKQYLRT